MNRMCEFRGVLIFTLCPSISRLIDFNLPSTSDSASPVARRSYNINPPLSRVNRSQFALQTPTRPGDSPEGSLRMAAASSTLPYTRDAGKNK